MGTRSRIGILNDDNTVTSVYCHWDGYPEHNGKILYNYYNTKEKILELLSYGNISSLGENIGTAHDFNKPVSGICTFYGRDRGENDVLPFISESEKCYYDNGEEYNYLYKDGKWFINDPWNNVTKELVPEMFK